MKLFASDDELTITFERWEIFWALKRKLVIPRADIISLSYAAQYALPVRLLRVMGTDVPGLLWAGRFFGSGQRAFLYVQRPAGFTWSSNPQPMQNVLVITLQNNRYDLVVVSCRQDIGAQLEEWAE
jgi:hypothetical protein